MMFLKFIVMYSGFYGEIFVVCFYVFVNYYGEFISFVLIVKNWFFVYYLVFFLIIYLIIVKLSESFGWFSFYV